MKEDFLHHIWKYKLFNHHELLTDEGESIEILHPGHHNMDSGPDFFNAKIKINEILWAGNVEIHINSSDWKNHGHQADKAYENVILHVIYEGDFEAITHGKKIPVLRLKGKIPDELKARYAALLNNPEKIPCARQIREIEDFYFDTWLERMAVERLKSKTDRIQLIYQNNEKQSDQTFYELLARNFGFNINAEPMQMLANRTPVKLLAKHKQSLFQTEAILLGQAGFLDTDFEDEYPRKLKAEYEFLKHKSAFTSLHKSVWKFSKTRPNNFPTIRIAQLAAFLCKSSFLISKIIESKSVGEIKSHLLAEPHSYWDTHFYPDKPSRKTSKKLSSDAVNNIIINTVSTFLFFVGEQKNNEELKEKAIDFLKETESEKNKFTRIWEDLGKHPKDASQSQAMIHLTKSYCNLKKCLSCSIGTKILKS